MVPALSPIEWRQLEELVAKAHPTFARYVGEILKLHGSKGHDYGTQADTFANVRTAEDFGLRPSLGVAMRMNDKMRRIQSYYKRGSLKHESVRDAFLDCANYGLIALCLLDEEEQECDSPSPAATGG